MARYTGPRCKLCRREGEKLFLKGERCRVGNKCPFDRQQKPRAYPPGEHGMRRPKFSDYGVQLREKQKMRRTYGIFERQFRRYFGMAERQTGMTGEMLLRILESRLDNTIYRLGLSTSRAEARQLVKHGHVLVNGRRVDIPSFLVSVGNVVTVKEKSHSHQSVTNAMEFFSTGSTVSWLKREPGSFEGVVDHIPTREEMPVTLQEQLVVEFYSKV